MSRQRNQHKPRRESFVVSFYSLIFFVVAPDEVIRGPLTLYFQMGVADVEAAKLLKFHYDTATYGLR
jgi:hypothetical protein